jgi:hypothetical protein
MMWKRSGIHVMPPCCIMDNSPYQALATALRDRMTVIADRDFYARDPAGHLEKLKAVSEQITTLAAALPKPVDGELAHYLLRASYAKALAWLETHAGAKA